MTASNDIDVTDGDEPTATGTEADAIETRDADQTEARKQAAGCGGAPGSSGPQSRWR